MSSTLWVQGVYLTDVEFKDPTSGEEVRLNVWKNPNTGKYIGVVNMDVDARNNFVNDPYEDMVKLVFHDTFTGLPK